MLQFRLRAYDLRVSNQTQSANSTDYVDILAKVSALAAVLVPAAGVFTRWVAFAVGPSTGATWELATSAPLGQLVLTGSLTLLPLLTIAIVWSLVILQSHVSFRRARLRRSIKKVREDFEASRPKAKPAAAEPATDEMVEGLKKEVDVLKEINDRIDQLQRESDELEALARQANPAWISRLGPPPGPAWVWFPLPALVAIAAIVFSSGWPYVLLIYLVAGLGVLILWVAGRRPTPLTMRQLWPWVVVLMVLASVAAGLTDSVVGVSGRRFTFAPGAPLSDGHYVPIAHQDDMVFLQQCPGKGQPLVAVHQSAIISSTLDYTAPAPSLWEILFAGKHASALGREGFC